MRKRQRKGDIKQLNRDEVQNMDKKQRGNGWRDSSINEKDRGGWGKTIDKDTRQAEDRGKDKKRRQKYKVKWMTPTQPSVIFLQQIYSLLMDLWLHDCVYHRFVNSFSPLFRLFQRPQTGVIMSIPRTDSVSVKLLLKNTKLLTEYKTRTDSTLVFSGLVLKLLCLKMHHLGIVCTWTLSGLNYQLICCVSLRKHVSIFFSSSFAFIYMSQSTPLTNKLNNLLAEFVRGYVLF